MATSAAPTDVIGMFKRRRWHFLMPFLVLLAVSGVTALTLPSVYEATATIQIERQHIPRNLLDTSAQSGRMDEYLEVLSQRVLSDESLWDIAAKLNVFPELRAQQEKHLVGVAMRGGIGRETVYLDVGPPGQRRADSVAIAYTVSYRAGDARTARDVANALAMSYLEVSEQVRTGQAAQLTQFLRGESNRLAQRVADLERKLAEFKEQHGASLPEFTDLNLRRMDSLQSQVDAGEERRQALVQQRIALQAELARLEPQGAVVAIDRRTLSPAQQVERLRLDYLSLTASYAPVHPDLVRLRSDLKALTGAVPRAGEILRLVDEIETSRTQHLDLERRYGPQHREVQAQAQRVRALKAELNSAELAVPDAQLRAADNPAYVTIKARLQAIEAELAADRQLQETLRQRLREYENRVDHSPGIEREYRALTRDYESVLSEYRETHRQLLAAEVAEKVERERIGDRFTLLSAASMPDGPASPNRPGIALLGFIFAAGVGTVVAALSEYLDRNLRGPRSVSAILGQPPLAAIPRILTKREKSRRAKRAGLMWGAGGLLIAAIVIVGISPVALSRTPAPSEPVVEEGAQAVSAGRRWSGAATSARDE